MKLNVPAVLVAALYGGLSNALNTHVKIADVPSHVEVGQQIRLDWSNDYDYVRCPASCVLQVFRLIDTGVAPMYCSVTNPWLVSESERVRPLQDRRPYQETPSRCSTPVGLARGQPQYDLERSQCAGARRVSKLRIPISHWPLQLVPCSAFVADAILAEPTQSGLEAGSC